MAKAELSIGGRPVPNPTASRAPRFAIGGVEQDVGAILADNEFRPSPLRAAAEAVDSSEKAAEAAEMDVQQGDPTTSWFQTSPMDPVIFDRYKALGAVDQFEDAFAREYSRWNPQTVEEYVQLGDRLLQHTPDMAPHVKKRMFSMMPEHLKKQYESKLAKAQARQQVQEEIDIEQFRREQINATLPEGWTVGPDGKIYETGKIEAQRRKSLMDELKTLTNRLDADSTSPRSRARIERRIDHIEGKLDEMDGFDPIEVPGSSEQDEGPSVLGRIAQQIGRSGAQQKDIVGRLLKGRGADQAEAQAEAPVVVKTKADRDALPAGALYVAPDGTTRRKK